MKHCETCACWENEQKPRFEGDSFAIGRFCTSLKLSEYVFGEYKPDMLIYDYNEGGLFWVGPKFGCVHHEEKETS